MRNSCTPTDLDQLVSWLQQTWQNTSASDLLWKLSWLWTLTHRILQVTFRCKVGTRLGCVFLLLLTTPLASWLSLYTRVPDFRGKSDNFSSTPMGTSNRNMEWEICPLRVPQRDRPCLHSNTTRLRFTVPANRCDVLGMVPKHETALRLCSQNVHTLLKRRCCNRTAFE